MYVVVVSLAPVHMRVNMRTRNAVAVLKRRAPVRMLASKRLVSRGTGRVGTMRVLDRVIAKQAGV